MAAPRRRRRRLLVCHFRFTLLLVRQTAEAPTLYFVACTKQRTHSVRRIRFPSRNSRSLQVRDRITSFPAPMRMETLNHNRADADACSIKVWTSCFHRRRLNFTDSLTHSMLHGSITQQKERRRRSGVESVKSRHTQHKAEDAQQHRQGSRQRSSPIVTGRGGTTPTLDRR